MPQAQDAQQVLLRATQTEVLEVAPVTWLSLAPLGGEGSAVLRPVTTAKHGLQAPLPQAALRACKSQPQGSPPLWRILKIAQDRSRKETREVLTSAAPELYCCFNSINFPLSLQLWLQSCYTVQEKPLPGFHRSHAVS